MISRKTIVRPSADCSKLVHGRDCLERNARKLCKSCTKYDRQERIRDLQDELDEHLEKLSDASVHELGDYQPIESGVNIANLFAEMVEIHFRAEDCWLENLSGVRISALRRFANYAGNFGLDTLAELIRKHIALRQGMLVRSF